MLAGQRLSVVVVVILLSLALLAGCHGDHDDHAEDRVSEGEDAGNDFTLVTCGSLVKLMHRSTKARLHSHEVPYGSGSGQQSVTGQPSASDPNSHWLVKAGHGANCQRGVPIKCGSVVRLEHVSTKKNLHSHNYQSPLSKQQEVSAYGTNGIGDAGDDFRLECPGTFWVRGEAIRLKHVATSTWLHSHAHQYQHPIPGQHEVTCFSSKNLDNLWQTAEGLYFPAAAAASK